MTSNSAEASPIRSEQKRLKSDVNYFNYNQNKKSRSEKLVDDITRQLKRTSSNYLPRDVYFENS